MNIRQQLLRENSRKNADAIDTHVAGHPGRTVELMACFFSDEERVAQRAAQVVGLLGRRSEETLKPWWSEMLAFAKESDQPAIRRHVTRYFSELNLKLPVKLERNLVDLCSKFVANPNEKVATRVFSMQFIADRADRYPENAKQLQANLIRFIPAGSTGFKSRGNKVLRQLAKHVT